MGWRVRRDLLVPGLLVVITACQAADAPSAQPPVPAASTRITISQIPMVRAAEIGASARLDGRLAISDGCLVVVDSAGMSWAIVWPSPGVEWNGQALELNGHPLQVGNLIALGGGEGSMSSASSDAIEWIQRPVDGCLQQDGLWFATGVA